jgi:hypothetical protein
LHKDWLRPVYSIRTRDIFVILVQYKGMIQETLTKYNGLPSECSVR